MAKKEGRKEEREEGMEGGRKERKKGRKEGGRNRKREREKGRKEGRKKGRKKERKSLYLSSAHHVLNIAPKALRMSDNPSPGIFCNRLLSNTDTAQEISLPPQQWVQQSFCFI